MGGWDDRVNEKEKKRETEKERLKEMERALQSMRKSEKILREGVKKETKEREKGGG